MLPVVAILCCLSLSGAILQKHAAPAGKVWNHITAHLLDIPFDMYSQTMTLLTYPELEGSDETSDVYIGSNQAKADEASGIVATTKRNSRYMDLYDGDTRLFSFIFSLVKSEGPLAKLIPTEVSLEGCSRMFNYIKEPCPGETEQYWEWDITKEGFTGKCGGELVIDQKFAHTSGCIAAGWGRGVCTNIQFRHMKDDYYLGKDKDAPTDVPVTTSTSAPDPVTYITGALPVCSVFPAGVIESFAGVGSRYDLACTHVLAAEIIAGGTYGNAWFVYGTFDEFEGEGALSAMTIYTDIGIELQRGWVVNVGGSKLRLQEDVPQYIEGSGCTVTFASRHLELDCVYFTAYYDGVMAGHILVKVPEPTTTAIVKGYGSFGLCYDNESGFRKNWQVGFTAGRCEVVDSVGCDEEDDSCAGLTSAPLFLNPSPPTWGSCGSGATVSCNELNCGDNVATATQTCALEQANRVAFNLKYVFDFDEDQASDPCPEECDWKNDIVTKGCPQVVLPFVCP